MAQAHLRLIIDARNEMKAQRVLDQLLSLVEADVVSIEKYQKGGFESQVRVTVPPDNWPNQVFFMLELSQSFGRGWTLSGQIDDEIDLSATEFNIQGLQFAWLTFVKP